MAWRGAAAGADEICGDDGLAVAGLEGVEGAEAGGEEGGGDEEPEAHVLDWS